VTTTISQQWNGEDVKIKGQQVINKSAYEIGLVVQGQAQTLAPRKSGRLIGSITTQSNREGTNVEAPATSADKIGGPNQDGEVYVGTAVEYGPYVEFGTQRSQAQSYLRPALDLAMGKALTIVMKNGRFQFKEYLRETV
jgi:hypothetical protein